MSTRHGTAAPASDIGAATAAPADPWWRRNARDLLWGAAAALLALVGAVVSLRLWRAYLEVPLWLGGDAYLAPVTVKIMQTEGWYGWTPDLGWPLGQNLDGWPGMVGDTWNLVALKILSTVLSPAASVNVYFVLGFPLIALVAYAGLRVLRVSAPIACALAITYALLPYHFVRGISHVFLSAYFAVPVACVLGVLLLEDRLHLVSGRRLTRAGWLALAGAALLAGDGMYYAAFAVVVMLAGGTFGAIAHRTRRPILAGAALSAVVLAGVAVTAIPNLVYRFADHGVMAEEGRQYGATEFFGLKIVNLLLPSPEHRIPALAALRAQASDSPIPGEGTETLGILGVVGLVVVVVVALIPWRRLDRGATERLRTLGILSIVSLLCATVAGLNSVVAVLVSGELRAWNRMSIVIAFLALAGLGVLVDAGLARLRGRVRWPRAATVATAAALTAIAVFDQTSDAFVVDYSYFAQHWDADEAYFAEVQDTLGAGAAVFQLPVVPYPEAGTTVDMTDYEHFRGYLHSDLKWSYGGLKGGEADWQETAFADGAAAGLPSVVAAGFDAVYVDRQGYEDSGRAVEDEIRRVTGVTEPLVSADGVLATYDIRGYAERLRAEGGVPDPDSVLHAYQLDYGAGVYGPETADDGSSFRWAGAEANLTVFIPGSAPAKVELSGTIRTGSPTAAVTVRVGSETSTFTAVDGEVPLDLRVEVHAGVTPVVIATDSARADIPADPRDLRQQLVGLRLSPAE